jgi:hypothetical protein
VFLVGYIEPATNAKPGSPTASERSSPSSRGNLTYPG